MKSIIYTIITLLILSLSVGCGQKIVESDFKDYPTMYDVQNEPDVSKGIEFKDTQVDPTKRTINYLDIGGGIPVQTQ